MRKRRILALIIVFTMIVSSLTFGFSSMHEFRDMPDNWSTQALQNAVHNGLLNGADGKIMPDDNLTRAQMATVINRAFGAEVKADIQSYADVSVGAWYFDEMAKAVQMKTFQGSGNNLNPDDPITREQAFIVMARALKLVKSEQEPEGFSDLTEISSWAKDEVFSMIETGYVKGSNEKIYPKSTITRAEFAQLMDNLIKQYISVAGEYTEVVAGNIMINVPDVTLKNVTVTGDLIIGDGVGDGDVTLDSVEVTGRLVVRGGGTDTIFIKGDSNIQNIVIARVDGVVRVYNQTGVEIGEVIIDGSDDVILDGRFGHIELLADDVDVYALRATFDGSNVLGDNSRIILPEEPDRESVRSVSIEGDSDFAGSTISAVVVPSAATVNYRWLISDTVDGDFIAIEGEISSNYEINVDDIGKFIKVEARGTGDYRRTKISDAVVIGFGGFDEAKGAYEIANWHHLDNVRYILDGNFIMTANIGAPEDNYTKVMPEITYETKGYHEVLGETGFEPIGRPVLIGSVSTFAEEDDFLSQLFTGSFDGDYHTIKGLYVDKGTMLPAGAIGDMSNTAGLFGIIYQAEIRNLTIKDSGIFGTHYVGALAGYSRESTISNVHNSSDYIMTRSSVPQGVVLGYSQVGGIVGINDSGTITNASNASYVVGEEYIGGIAGNNQSDNYDNRASVMEVLEPTLFEAYITDSWNEGQVMGNRNIGGIAGSNSSLHDYGSLGEIQSSVYLPEIQSFISRCYNIGTIVPIDPMFLYIGDSPIGLGGITGFNTGTISESYNEGNVGDEMRMSLSLNNVEISGVAYEALEVGGIVGSEYLGKILNSYNKGSIYGAADVGGIVGYADNSEIINNYNVGTISSTDVYDRTLAMYYGQTIYGYDMDSYFAGNYFLVEEFLPDMVEAMIGYSGIYGGTIEELRNPLTYLQGVYYKDFIEDDPWNFEDIWFMNLSTNNGLPILRWEEEMYATETSLSVIMPTFTAKYGESAAQAQVATEGAVEAYGQPLDGEFTIIDNLDWLVVGIHRVKTSFSVSGDSDFLTFHGYSEITVLETDLTVTADNQSKPYDGGAYSPFTASYSGFVFGEDVSNLGGSLEFTGSAISAAEIGTYTITPYGLTSYNYNIIFADGTLTIIKADPMVTWPDTIYIARNEAVTEDYFTGESSTPSGTFSITDDTTSWSIADTYGLDVEFTPNDTTHYNTAEGTVDIVVEELIYEDIDVRHASGEIDLLFNLPTDKNSLLTSEDFMVVVTIGEIETALNVDVTTSPDGSSDYFTIACNDPSDLEAFANAYKIKVTINPSGASKLIDNGGNLLNTDVLMREYSIHGIVYEEDFEEDNGGFTHYGTYDEWEWGTPDIWPGVAATGVKCWGTDLDDNYENNANMTLLSPTIDLTYLPDGISVNVQWMQAWYIESSTWDNLTVQYTIDGGSTWTDIWVHNNSTIQESWQSLGYDISDAAGKTVQLRWRFTTDGSVTYSGIYIDDIMIEVGNSDFVSTEIVYPTESLEVEKEVQSE